MTVINDIFVWRIYTIQLHGVQFTGRPTLMNGVWVGMCVAE